MDLFENELVEEKNKNSKIAKMIIIAIVLISLLCVGILVAITMLQSQQLRVYIDNSATSLTNNTLIIEDTGKVYISINDMAKIFGYEYLNGEYEKTSEDNTKGFVRNPDEIVSFEANSKRVYKIVQNSNRDLYNYFYIDENIKFMNSKLYTTPEGIKTIFNANFEYNVETNMVTIFTLPYLTEYYTGKIAEYGYKNLDNEFENLKALTSDMIIAIKEDGKAGIITTEGKQIISPKYDKIRYVETTKDFFVTANAKVGLVSNTGRTKINLLYDSIELLDKDKELYLVRNDGKSGVLDKNGNIIIYLEYEQIGIDLSQFKNSDIKNPYLIFDNCIPVMKDKKWGILDVAGREILPVSFDFLGCVIGTSNVKSTNNVIIIPDYEAIVVGKDKLYGIYNAKGEKLVEIALTSVYSVTSSGKTVFEMEYNEKRLNVEEYFNGQGIKKINKNVVNDSDEIDDINITSVNNTSKNTENTANTTENTEENANTTEENVEE